MTSRETDPSVLLTDLASYSPAECAARIDSIAWSPATCAQLCDELDGLAMRDLTAALTVGNALVTRAQASEDPIAIARARRSWAQILAYANRFEDSLEQVQLSIDAAKAAECPEEEARAQLTSLHALARLGRFEEAIRNGEHARDVFAKLNETKLMGRASANLGVTHRMHDEPSKALEYFTEAIELLNDDPMATAQLQSNRAEALLDLYQFVAAEAAFIAARQLFTQIGAHRAAAIVEGNLADLTSRQGRIEEALAHFERAANLFEDAAAPGDLARLRAEQAEVFVATGAWDEAIELYERAVEPLREHGMAWETARALAGYGVTLAKVGRSEEAEGHFVEAAERFAALGHKTYCARLHMLRGDLAMLNGRANDARLLFIESLEQLESREPAREGGVDTAIVRHRLGALALRGSNLPAAEAFLTEAAIPLERLRHAPAFAELLQTRAALRSVQGKTMAAIDDLRRAIQQIERTRGVLPAGRLRAAYLGHRADAYSQLLSMLLDRDSAEANAEAFSVAERARGRALLDTMSGVIVQETSQRPSVPMLKCRITELRPRHESPFVAGVPYDSDEVVTLRRELNALYARVDVLSRDDGQQADDADVLQLIERRERELALAESRLAVRGGLGQLFAESADVDAVASALPAGAVLVEYFIAGDSLGAFVIRDGRLHVKRDLSDRASLDELVSRFNFQLSRSLARMAAASRSSGQPSTSPSIASGDIEDELAALYESLMRPLASLIDGASRLIVVPFGPLHALPFPALLDRDAGSYLIESFEVCTVPSASALTHLQSIEPGSGGQLVVGVPDEQTPSIESEVRRVAEVLPDAELFFGEQATVSRMVERMPGCSLIHLACHGRFSPLKPMGSGLRLADRWLTVREIFDLDLRGAMVTLSACNSGRSEVDSGEELMGLVRGFFVAGATRLLISLWPLNDKSAQKMMASVYDVWQNGKKTAGESGAVAPGFASALAETQRRMIQEKVHPALWAPVMLIGME